MNITFVGNYPPRLCGIATFTQHLAQGISDAAKRHRQRFEMQVIAINDGKSYDYPPVVSSTIEQQNKRDYLLAAEAINRSDTDAVVLQHEFGIYGGDAGMYILSFAERLKKPLIVTMHTVLRQPNDQQRLVVQRLGVLAQRLVVMSSLAVRMLGQVYRIPASKIERIEHGSPEFDYSRRPSARRQLDLGNRHTLLTFGLLGRGKGIETAIEALPALKAVRPDFLYILLGKTHPNVVAHEGEAYRDGLWARVEELGLAENVRFVNEYADEDMLRDYLLATDVYVLPYPNEAQITSGTLSYAVGAGCAVVSTPFWHAKELLAENRGRFFPFDNPPELGHVLTELATDEAALASLRASAKSYGATTTWPDQGAEYLSLIHQVGTEKPISRKSELPAIDLQHIYRLTDDTGMLQHATFHLPNRKEGYCLDDNVRAIVFVVQSLELGGDRNTLEPLLDNYLSLLTYLQQDDGRFHNFLSYTRNYLDLTGSPDSFGRTIWALGRLLGSRAVSQDHKDLAWQLYQSARPHIAGLRSLRAVAFCLLGLQELHHSELYSENVRAFTEKVGEFLLAEYAAASDEEWTWFESALTYGNAILPCGCLAAFDVTGDSRYQVVATASTAFLERYTFSNRMIHPIGCHTFARRGEAPSRYDQQPLDAMAMVYLYCAWYACNGDERNFEKAQTSFGWFVGLNELGLPLFNAERGSCYDGLMERGINQNQGAESTLAFWLARNRIAIALAKEEPAQFDATADQNLERYLPSHTRLGGSVPAA